MNKRIILFTLFFVLLLPGCSSDEDATSSLNKSSTGASAHDLLANTTFDALLIEIAYVSGFRPTDEAIANFETFLRERTFKEDIEFTFQELPSPNQETLTTQEIRTLEEENRTVYNTGSTLAVYLYFTDAPSNSDTENEVILGAAYLNTSIVIFEATIKRLAENNSSFTVADMETATINHEFGHLLGLVNIGSDPVNPNHEDTDRGHCNVEGCLMQSKIEFGNSLARMMKRNAFNRTAIVPTLGAECIRDLQNNGGR